MSSAPAIANRPLSFAIPREQAGALNGLKECARNRVLATLAAFEQAAQESSNARELIAMAAGALGLSCGSARRLYYEFQKTGDWRALVDKRQVPELWHGSRDRLSPAFLKHWHGLILSYQRDLTGKVAYAALLDGWRRHEAIPGFAEWPAPEARTGLPFGWSYGNLMRHAPADFAKRSVRQGRFAASDHRPLVLTTRRGLYVGSHLMIDDIWLDFQTSNFDSKQIGRPLMLWSLDYYSGYVPTFGGKVRTLGADGKHEQLKEAEMRFLLEAHFRSVGYSRRGTIIPAEGGTATVRKATQKILSIVSNGAISVQIGRVSGHERQRAASTGHGGQYAAKGGGNPRFKGALESLGNALHNRLSNVPGQTGRNRDFAPEEGAGREAYARRLIKAAANLSPERAALLQLPYLPWSEAFGRFTDALAMLHDDAQHELEGWEHFLPLDGLPGLPGMRRATRREVFLAGAHELQRFSLEDSALVLGADLGKARRVSRRMIEWGDEELSADPLFFDLSETAIRDGREVMAVVNSFAADGAFIYDAEGRFLAFAKLLQRACRGDQHAVEIEMGRVAHIEAQLTAPVREVMAPAAEERRRLMAHNERVLSGAPVTLEEKRIARVEGRQDLGAVFGPLPEANDHQTSTADEFAADVPPQSEDAEIEPFDVFFGE